MAALLAGTGLAAFGMLGESQIAALSGGVLWGAGLLGLLAARRGRIRADALDVAQAQLRAQEDALARAEEENAAKSRFLAEMSHELRTPLNAVIGFSEMMAHEVFGPHTVSTYGEYARDIHTSGRHLLALADDILDLARIETGHRALLETAVSLPDLAGDCTHMMRLSAAARSVTLTCAPGETPLRLWADERALRQMVLNLLGNAIKFTPHGGEVHISTGLDGRGAPYLEVTDTGPGIGEAELPLDLAARHRESTLDPTTGRGAGLGLTIVRALAGLHGAELTLSARPEGGTRASVTFPAARLLPTFDAPEGARAIASTGV
ncbi:sensor histidine kinase [Aquabacter cavernae]|uniref:sensor histidine kinase n=1 Tax=Aquabacter cavernae TaxID=2496029 RepID=UPI000F8ECCCA|nr:ATP-binding protein [Aquabacter cavernae]